MPIVGEHGGTLDHGHEPSLRPDVVGAGQGRCRAAGQGVGRNGMSLVERLASWADPHNWDSPEQATEEAVLRQFVYSTIASFIEEKDEELVAWLTGQADIGEVPGLNDWVDEYAERPTSEPDGWEREEGS